MPKFASMPCLDRELGNANGVEMTDMSVVGNSPSRRPGPYGDGDRELTELYLPAPQQIMTMTFSRAANRPTSSGY